MRGHILNSHSWPAGNPTGNDPAHNFSSSHYAVSSSYSSCLPAIDCCSHLKIMAAYPCPALYRPFLHVQHHLQRTSQEYSVHSPVPTLAHQINNKSLCSDHG